MTEGKGKVAAGWPFDDETVSNPPDIGDPVPGFAYAHIPDELLRLMFLAKIANDEPDRFTRH